MNNFAEWVRSNRATNERTYRLPLQKEFNIRRLGDSDEDKWSYQKNHNHVNIG